MTTKGPAWLDCQGQDAGDGKVRCTIPVLGGGTRQVVVPSEAFDAPSQRLKVTVIKLSNPPLAGGTMLDCPSMESGIRGFLVECPTVEEGVDSRIDVLTTMVEMLDEEPEWARR